MISVVFFNLNDPVILLTPAAGSRTALCEGKGWWAPSSSARSAAVPQFATRPDFSSARGWAGSTRRTAADAPHRALVGSACRDSVHGHRAGARPARRSRCRRAGFGSRGGTGGVIRFPRNAAPRRVPPARNMAAGPRTCPASGRLGRRRAGGRAGAQSGEGPCPVPRAAPPRPPRPAAGLRPPRGVGRGRPEAPVGAGTVSI